MRIMLFGATGMVGQGIVRECLFHEGITSVVCVGRNPSGASHPKLRDLIHKELTDFHSLEAEFSNIDACIFAVGISVTTAGPALFEKINCAMPLAVASKLLMANPQASFVYVSADGVDPSEKSSQLWKRLRGRTENQLRALPFKQMTILRPLVILPAHGESSRTRAYRIFYGFLGPLLRPLRTALPQFITTTELLGKAILHTLFTKTPSQILDSRSINQLGEIG